MTMNQHTKPRDILAYLKCDQSGSSDHWEKERVTDQWLATWHRNKIADFLLPTYF